MSAPQEMDCGEVTFFGDCMGNVLRYCDEETMKLEVINCDSEDPDIELECT